jgi:tetratricopeptide (TPR) repeat protein
MIKNLLKVIFVYLFLVNSLNAKTEYFQEGINLFNLNKFDDAKFKFEQDIVYNPKNELSYLYLSKIFNKQDKRELEEQNLNTVMLLNPNNEEAIFYLVKLKLSSSDYKKSKELNKKLKLICNNFCDQSDKLKIEIENLSKK